jgi:predicted kinase
MTHFVMMVGLPASGKSTYAKNFNLYGGDFVTISSDAIRKELFGDESVQKDNGRVFGEVFKRVKSNLLKGNNVIVDATFINRKSRKGLLEMVSKIADVSKEAIVMTTPYHVCIARDAERNRTVGREVIKKFLMRFQIPMYSEGFDEIYIVKHDYHSDDTSNIYGHSINNPHHKDDDLVSHCINTRRYISNHYNVGSCNLLIASDNHDIGFPMTETVDDNGISHYYGHENVGAYLWLNRNVNNFLEYSEYDVHRITALINYHMLPYSWCEEKIRETFKDDFLFADELMVLNEADRKAM